MRQYSRVTYEDRCHISAWMQDGISVSEVAQRLGFNKSTIYRELQRNSSTRGYLPSSAKQKARRRYKKCRKAYRLQGQLKRLVVQRLQLDWSPEQISERFKMEGLGSLSHECIYQMIRQDLNRYRPHLRRLRRFKGCGRYKQKGTHRHSFQPNIKERPKAADQRLRLGDIERDIMFAKSKTPILVCVDRKSRYTVIRQVNNL